MPSESEAPAPPIKSAYPDGHFYSPVVDPASLHADSLWPENPSVLGLDFDDASHERILRETFPRFMARAAGRKFRADRVFHAEYAVQLARFARTVRPAATVAAATHDRSRLWVFNPSGSGRQSPIS